MLADAHPMLASRLADALLCSLMLADAHPMLASRIVDALLSCSPPVRRCSALLLAFRLAFRLSPHARCAPLWMC